MFEFVCGGWVVVGSGGEGVDRGGYGVVNEVDDVIVGVKNVEGCLVCGGEVEDVVVVELEDGRDWVDVVWVIFVF